MKQSLPAVSGSHLATSLYSKGMSEIRNSDFFIQVADYFSSILVKQTELLSATFCKIFEVEKISTKLHQILFYNYPKTNLQFARHIETISVSKYSAPNSVRFANFSESNYIRLKPRIH